MFSEKKKEARVSLLGFVIYDFLYAFCNLCYSSVDSDFKIIFAHI